MIGREFVSKAKKSMKFISVWGFIPKNIIVTDKYELLSWQNERTIIEIVYDKYEFSVYASFYYNSSKVDVACLYDELQIHERLYYQFHDESGFEKALAEVSCGIHAFLNHFDAFDLTDLFDVLNKNIINPIDELNKYYLNIADQAYLNGDYNTAKKYYLLSEEYMNNLQKKRLKKILTILP